ncbi:MAG: N-acetyltransferase [Terriglobia bacterium]
MISALTPETVSQQTTSNKNIEVRKASMADIPALLELINGYAAKGIMLPRTEFELSENMRDFSVAYDGKRLAGCGALHFYSPAIGEVRSLAVAESHKTHGIGRLIVEALVYEAKMYGLDAVFAFTYVPRFFGKVGFNEVERGELPLKAWKDCLRCPKFSACDEIAVLRVLRPQRWEQRQALPPVLGVEGGMVVILPTVRGR